MMKTKTTILLLFLNVLTAYAVFNPDVRWTCSEDSVSIFVRTPKPFEGLIQASPSEKIASEKCRTHGMGTNVAILKLKLTSNECGVLFDENMQEYNVAIRVQSHPVLIIDGDKHLNITCSARNESHFSVQNDVPFPSDFQLRVLSNRQPTLGVRYSQPYTIQVRPLAHRAKANSEFFVGQCTAQPVGGNITVQLTDPIGCALFKSIMGNFVRKDVVEEADVPSMFRFPDSRHIKISCVVNQCDGVCEKRSCDSEGSASSILDRTTASVESEETQIASITVHVENQMLLMNDSPEVRTSTSRPKESLIIRKIEEKSEAVERMECPTQFDLDVMYYLCVFLAFCSIIGFSLNIFLCLLLKRKTMEKRQKPLATLVSPPATKASSNHPDFWIAEPEATNLHRRESACSYASVRKPRRSQLNSEYGIPTVSHSSASGSIEGKEIYRRGLELQRPEVRYSNSTFISHSTTAETDLDGSLSNQTSSYH